ncbi:hypothetical protein MDOR_04010 [Mycolicibacterium doricum]|uniref:Uncharacterized protein n=1 Tax=Mycolicibacterium doricum TaxID=126673 RepID=A0A7I7VNG5_9MYCO|nr:nitroreductase/quinone reductase family protein [Mycolicibacterium doricum]BBZ06232.1 hypothetical protein MDOR_04010 [Mycolicibacterium doricum]
MGCGTRRCRPSARVTAAGRCLHRIAAWAYQRWNRPPARRCWNSAHDCCAPAGALPGSSPRAAHRPAAAAPVRRPGGRYEGTFVGEEVTGAERDRLWELAKNWIPSYTDYEKSTQGRTIPILAFTEIALQ